MEGKWLSPVYRREDRSELLRSHMSLCQRQDWPPALWIPRAGFCFLPLPCSQALWYFLALWCIKWLLELDWHEFLLGPTPSHLGSLGRSLNPSELQFLLLHSGHYIIGPLNGHILCTRVCGKHFTGLLALNPHKLLWDRYCRYSHFVYCILYAFMLWIILMMLWGINGYTVLSQWLTLNCGYCVHVDMAEKAKNLVLRDLNFQGRGSQTINKIIN